MSITPRGLLLFAHFISSKKEAYHENCALSAQLSWYIIRAMQRADQILKIKEAFRNHPVVALLGPRQCGKTTLSKEYSKGTKNVHYFDLENPIDLAKLGNPTLVLEELEGLIVIDEIQRMPNLFTVLRVLVDEYRDKQKYLVLGSASRDLVNQSSETLAGRIKYIELTPFSVTETQDIDKTWIRGGFPRSFLAQTQEDSFDWRESYIQTFLEKDIPQLGINIAANTVRRFWTMLTQYHGNILNTADLGRSMGVAHTTIRHYIDILTGTFMIRELQPWHENIKKRQVKSPKIYFRDSGILHSLMGILNKEKLQNSPKLGASWEGFALEEVIRKYEARARDCFFWATHQGAELDLLIFKNNRRIGFEFKYSEKPSLTKSMKIAVENLKLDELIVIHPKKADFPLDKNIRATGLPFLIDKASLKD